MLEPSPYQFKNWPHEALQMGWQPPIHHRSYFNLGPRLPKDAVMQEDYKRAADLGIPYTTIENIAQVCHEANRAYQNTIGDFTNQEWAYISQELRDSCRKGVLHALENPDTTPERSHEKWLEHRAQHGWTYGPIKDEVAKTHPCFLPYSDLPMEHRAKDAMFLSIVRALDPRR